MIYGLSTHVVAREQLAEHHLDRIAGAGIDTIEIFANRHQVDFDNPVTLRGIARAVDRNALYVNSVHAPFYRSIEEIQQGIHLDIGSANEVERRSSVDEIAASFVLGTLFHVDYYILHAPDQPDPDALLKSLDELLTLSSELPFKLCLENIPGKTTDLSHINDLMDRHLLPIGICFDTGHSHLSGNVPTDIREYGASFYTTHIHDNDGMNDNHMMPFDGQIDWTAAMQAFRSVDYKWGFMLEVRRDPETPLEPFLARCTATLERFRLLETNSP